MQSSLGKESSSSAKTNDALLVNYGAVTDLPTILFAEELIRAYPESKVVLVERDIETWYRSFNEGIISPIWNPVIYTIAKLDTRFVGKLGSTSERCTKGWMEANSKREIQNNARRKYREHYEMVRRVTPPARLLNFKLEDGWEPLCAFVGRLIPDIDFPRVNESAALGEKVRLIAVKGIKNAMRAHAMVFFSVIAIAYTVFCPISSSCRNTSHAELQVTNDIVCYSIFGLEFDDRQITNINRRLAALQCCWISVFFIFIQWRSILILGAMLKPVSNPTHFPLEVVQMVLYLPAQSRLVP